MNSTDQKRREQKLFDEIDTKRKISCSVSNCHYHAGNDICTARQISVGPQHACCCQETICSTFKPENQ